MTLLGQPRVLAHREGDVLEDGEVGEEAALLEHHPDLAAQAVEPVVVERVDVLAAHLHGAARGPQGAADELQERRLAAAAGAQDGHDLAAGDVQLEPREHPRLP